MTHLTWPALLSIRQWPAPRQHLHAHLPFAFASPAGDPFACQKVEAVVRSNQVLTELAVIFISRRFGHSPQFHNFLDHVHNPEFVPDIVAAFFEFLQQRHPVDVASTLVAMLSFFDAVTTRISAIADQILPALVA